MSSSSAAIILAFYARRPHKIRTTSVIVKDDVTYLYIFDKIPIAQWVAHEKFISITDGGWQSDMAKCFLDSILLKTSYRIEIKNGFWHLRDIKKNNLTKMTLNSWYIIPFH